MPDQKCVLQDTAWARIRKDVGAYELYGLQTAHDDSFRIYTTKTLQRVFLTTAVYLVDSNWWRRAINIVGA